ncbi:MAG: proton-conducting transporter membrane subunit [Pirellulales bacterium]
MPAERLPLLLMLAWLLPLASFTVIWIGYSLPQMAGRRASYAVSKFGGWIACLAIITSCVLSFVALFGVWLPAHHLASAAHGHEAEHHGQADGHTLVGSSDFHLVGADAQSRLVLHAGGHGDHTHGDAHADHPNRPPTYYSGDWYALTIFGDLKITIGYYIDALTVGMFCMVTLIASCVHVYATGYMHDELHDVTDHEVHLANGEYLHRPGRYHRFFQYLSLFCFSMLGIVIAGNLAMTFVFWELVGICSYFLIGFYIERHSASTAANKAFIVNRVGDFGMLIGLMALWASLGTFSFGDAQDAQGKTLVTKSGEVAEPGVFSLLRSPKNSFQLAPSDGMIAEAAPDQIAAAVRDAEVLGADEAGLDEAVAAKVAELRQDSDVHHGYWLLLVAGVGIFCGCVGKSAQFPLHTWLPDAMEGPTPVSALVHSATMVAAGVFLVGRAYPLFAPEALLVIAYTGAITLFIAATIALTATDIKRVLAYSTVSQLGFMMLALGVGGFIAGIFHLITHAFFKSLLFLCSGSVIHAVHTNEMTEMGGLRKKMPITAYTMLIGCLAIIGAGLPLSPIGFSGFYSKDAIVEQAWSFASHNPKHLILCAAPLVGAFMTAFYMFRLWYMTFIGKPRNHHRYEHAHESPLAMTGPLLLLAVFAVGVAWHFPFTNLSITNLLAQGQPVGTSATSHGVLLADLTIPAEILSHSPEVKIPAGLAVWSVAAAGFLLSTMMYAWRVIDPSEVRQTFLPAYGFLRKKWYFDELYNWLFVKPTFVISYAIAAFDRNVIDWFINKCAWACKQVATVVNDIGDRRMVDGTVDGIARGTWDFGLALRNLQTGQLRQYIAFIAGGTLMLFLIATAWFAFVR